MVTLRKKRLKAAQTLSEWQGRCVYITVVSTTNTRLCYEKGNARALCAFSCIVCACTMEARGQCPLPSSITLHNFETSTLTDPRSWEFSSISWTASSDPLLSFQCWNDRYMLPHSAFSMSVGIQLICPCFYSERFTCWATPQAHAL